MCCLRFPLSSSDRKAVARHLKPAQPLGKRRQVNSCLALLAVLDGPSCAPVALSLRVPEKTSAAGVWACCCDGLPGARHQKPPGRPPPLPPTQTAALAPRLEEGPGQAGCSGACGRAPLLPPLLDDRGGGLDHVFSRAPGLKNLGLRWQQAAFGSAHLDEPTRQAWRPQPWPQRRRAAHTQTALLRVGAAARWPPWGTRTDTGARRGQPPQVTTAGQRQGATVCGLLDACPGDCFSPGQDGRLHSAASLALRTRVLEQTTPPLLLRQAGAPSHPSTEPQAGCAQHTARLPVVQWPPDAPDANPREKLWQKSTPQETHLPSFPTLEGRTEKGEQALRKLTKTPEDMLTLCRLPTALAQAA
jgi:hypothetical protein